LQRPVYAHWNGSARRFGAESPADPRA